MRLTAWLFRSNNETVVDPIDIDAVLESARRHPQERSTALATLRAERARMERQRKVVDRRFKRLTSGRTKTIGWSSSANPNIAANMLRDEMRAANDANQLQNNDELVAIDRRLEAVERAITELNRR